MILKCENSPSIHQINRVRHHLGMIEIWLNHDTQDPLSDLKKVFGASPFLLDLLLWRLFSPSCHDKSPLFSKIRELQSRWWTVGSYFCTGVRWRAFLQCVKLQFVFWVFSNRFLATGKISAEKKSPNLLPNQLSCVFFYSLRCWVSTGTFPIQGWEFYTEKLTCPP